MAEEYSFVLQFFFLPGAGLGTSEVLIMSVKSVKIGGGNLERKKMYIFATEVSTRSLMV